MKIRQVGAELSHVENGRWDRHGKPNSRFRNFANASKNIYNKKKKSQPSL